MKKLLAVVVSAVALAACGSGEDAPSASVTSESSPEADVASPVAVFCEEQGGKAFGPEPMCGLPDGSTVDAWGYYRAEANGGGLPISTAVAAQNEPPSSSTSVPRLIDVAAQAEQELFDDIPSPDEIVNTRTYTRDAAVNTWETAPQEWRDDWCFQFDALGHYQFMGWVSNLFYEGGLLNELDATFASEYIEAFADVAQEKCV